MQATSIWFLALVKNCPERQPIKKKLQELQNVFMDLLSENSGMFSLFFICKETLLFSRLRNIIKVGLLRNKDIFC